MLSPSSLPSSRLLLPGSLSPSLSSRVYRLSQCIHAHFSPSNLYSIFPPGAANPSPCLLTGCPPLLIRRVCPYTKASIRPATVSTPPTMAPVLCVACETRVGPLGSAPGRERERGGEKKDAHVEVRKWARDWRVSRWMTCRGEIS